MPRFEPFAALRYAADTDWEQVIAPPYDVLSDADVDRLAATDPHNIVHVDVPREADGADRYAAAGDVLRQWIAKGVLVLDDEPGFTVYRMRFVDATGRHRDIAGVIGALEVVDTGAGGVLPHERTTPKASTDRLDLTRATRANLSPVWGLSLARGLSALLEAPGDDVGSVVVDGVEHVAERITDPERVARIADLVGAHDVLIADGHHRYGVARVYRDERRALDGRPGPADLTMTFVSELVADQLSVEAIHRVYRDIGYDDLAAALSRSFDLEPAGPVSSSTLASMDEAGVLCLVAPDGSGTWLHPRSGAFSDVRALDGVWLESALDGVDVEVSYQHGVEELLDLLAVDERIGGAVMIRPVGVGEIERTAREGLLMPPKSTFFTPKLRTGPVIRPLD
ncbi:MAG: DUF1015 family protein [Ilumatobacteraceae bacterium]